MRHTFWTAFVIALLTIPLAVPSGLGQGATFDLAVAPSIIHLSRNEPGFFSVRITSLNGFSGNVMLSVEGLEPEKIPERQSDEVIVSFFEPSQVTVPRDAFGYSRLKVTDTIAQTAQFVVRNRPMTFSIIATDGFTTKKADVNIVLLVKDAPDYFMTVSSETMVFDPQGTTQTFSEDIQIVPRNGFAGALFFTLQAPPQGMSASFNPESLTITPTGPLQTRLTLSITSTFNIQTATYWMAVTATGGERSVTKSVVFGIIISPKFTIRVTPASQSVDPGGSTTYQVDVSSTQGGFSGTVNFNLQGLPEQDAQFAFNPTTVIPPPGATASTTLTVSTTDRVPPATYPLNVVATTVAGGKQTVLITLDVNQIGDFTFTASPNVLSLSPQGSTTSQLTVRALNGFKSRISFATSTLPSGISASFNPPNIVPSPDTDVLVSLTLTASSQPALGSFDIDLRAESGEVVRTTRISIRISNTGCLIATATFGSELSPEVQFLRNFRDSKILVTHAGYAFMTVFNAWYYSFSPSVAQLIRENNMLRSIVKIFLYPLMASLHVSSVTYEGLAFLGNEIAVVAAGGIASALIGLAYLTPLLLGGMIALRHRPRFQIGSRGVRLLALLWAFLVLGIQTGLTFGSGILLAAATVGFVLTTMSLAALLVFSWLGRKR